MNKECLIIIGAGGHGSVVADIARLNGYKRILFLDDSDMKSKNNYAVVGKISEYEKFISTADFIVAIGNNSVRAKVQKRLDSKGANVVTLVHPNAVIGECVSIGRGTVVMAGAIVNPSVTIGDGVILNTCSSVDHNCVVGDFVHAAVDAHLCGTVRMGNRVFVGAGAILINNVSVCDNVVLGAGTVVIEDIKESGTYVGVPARKIK